MLCMYADNINAYMSCIHHVKYVLMLFMAPLNKAGKKFLFTS